MISTSQVYITLPGSGSFLGWFLPKHATIIRLENHAPNDGDKYLGEWHIFSNHLIQMHF